MIINLTSPFYNLFEFISIHGRHVFKPLFASIKMLLLLEQGLGFGMWVFLEILGD